MEILCFVGLTILPDEARQYLDARYFGPVSGGDLPAAIAEYRPRAIGIIDGLFHIRPAVLHKDILHALSLGVSVFGASSIGALRAAELDRYGMIGIGEIYQRFATGEWTGDDEVAVTCTFLPGRGWCVVEGYEALVNIRATVEEASQQGMITAGLARQIIDRAKSLCFMQRHWDVVLDPKAFGEGAASVQLLRNSLEHVRVDLKKKDALSLLQTIREWTSRINPLGSHGTCSEPHGPFWDKTLFSRPLTVLELGKDRGPTSADLPLLRDLLDYAVVADS